jgi:RNA polymerase sigma-70 factor (ECF subfamily)
LSVQAEPDRVVELYRRYGGTIYARCCQLLGDAATAEDATQETFLRVHRHLAAAPSAAEALGWIYRIATNYCFNELRNRRHRPQLRAELPESPAALRLEDQLGDRRLLGAIVRRVAPRVAAAAWLYHVDGMEQAEVARILGVSRRTVINRIREFEQVARDLRAEEHA